MTGTATILRGDARQLPFADDTFDLAVTSPPYWQLRRYAGDDGAGIGSEPDPGAYITNLVAATAELARVVKPSGSLFVNLADRYANTHDADVAGVPYKSRLGLPWRYAFAVMDQLGLTLRADIVWAKVNPIPSSVPDRVRCDHEYLFHFTMSSDYYADLDPLREPHRMRPQRRPFGRRTDDTPRPGQPRQSWSTSVRTEPGVDGHPLGRAPGSVWTLVSEPLLPPASVTVKHPAVFPVEIPRRAIQGWCPPDGRVVDPFGGSGTTALAAKVLGRHGVSVDWSEDYSQFAAWRVNDPRELAKAARVPVPPAVPQVTDGQQQLF